MFRIVRMNTWRKDASPDQVTAAVTALAGLPGQIPGVRRWYLGSSAYGEADNADLVVVADFDDQPAYERFLHHPAHDRVINELVRPLVAHTAVIRCAADGADEGTADG